MNGNNCLRQFLWFLRIWERRYLSEWLLNHLKSYQIVDCECKLPAISHLDSIKNIKYIILFGVRAQESERNF